MSDFVNEIRKIPPVTRFLCASVLAVSLPAKLNLVSPYYLVFIKELVTQRFEVGFLFFHNLTASLRAELGIVDSYGDCILVSSSVVSVSVHAGVLTFKSS
jgi:hypothetical protein